MAVNLPAQMMKAVPAPLHEALLGHWTQFGEGIDEAQWRAVAQSPYIASLCKVWACSPFVAQSCSRNPSMCLALLESGDLDRRYGADDYAAALSRALADVGDEAALGIALRRFRRREMVRIAWRDLAGWADLDETLWSLSALARACVSQALDRLGSWLEADYGTPQGRDGRSQSLIVVGMGKLGADELNYSSDIDLVFAYPDDGQTHGGRRTLSNGEFFIRLGRALITALNEATAEGFVFRVDMRLRPFGDAGPLAMSFEAMETYYQSHGRDWERYALVKADVIAGDREAGEALLSMLRPFVYRRYLDFGAFEALREMKAMIQQQVQHKGMADNIKLGPGGIREVEFIGQAYQLIRGGREPELQERSIRRVLRLLAQREYLPEYVAAALDNAYVFLRQAENRLQAMADKQTQQLPADQIDRLRLACAMGCDDWAEFEDALRRQMAMVHEHFQQVFAAPQREQAAEQESAFDIVWASVAGDEAAVAILAAQGYDDPQDAQRRVASLRDSSARRALVAQGRERLDRLMPLVLGAVALADAPTTTLTRVLKVIETIARRSAYLALLVEYPVALSQLIKLCSVSPWLADYLARYPLLLDELWDTRALYAPLDRADLEAELALGLQRAGDDQEQQMIALRNFKQANVLRVAAADLAGAYPLMVVSDHLTEIAEVVVAEVVRLAYAHLAARHGHPSCVIDGQPHEPGFIVIGYGKLGGIELSYGSDLDLVFVHGSQGDKQITDGRVAVDNYVFFARLGQRIIHIMTALTPAGTLYDVDARLRPSGDSGMLVSSMEAFEAYQRGEAWTWEHQALVRARVVAGDPELAGHFAALRREILGRPRDDEALRQEVRDMRRRMRQELVKTPEGQFDLKQGEGGIADIEFMVQYLVLRWAYRYPDLTTWSDNIRQLETLEAVGLLAPDDARLLADSYRAYRSAAHRLTLQQASAVVAGDRFERYRTEVKRIWRDLMGAVE